MFGGAAFVLGILAALFSAVLNQKSNQHAARIIGEAIGHAIWVSQTGEMNEAAEKAQNEFDKRLTKGAQWPPIAGWISALMFLAGIIIIGLTGGKSDAANVRRCAVVQHDMLSIQPRASSDAALFQALGCKPQGDELPFQH